MSKSANSLPSYDKDLCFIDIETTGTVFGYHEIIELGIIRTCPGANTVRFSWSKRIAPKFPERITAGARAINAFHEDNWSKELPTRDLWEYLASQLAGAVPVCHNPSFERAFLTLSAAAFGISDLGLDHHWIGTESLAWPLAKRHRLRRFSLEGICQLLGVPTEPKPHSALGGAEACLRVYQKLMVLPGAPPQAPHIP